MSTWTPLVTENWNTSTRARSIAKRVAVCTAAFTVAMGIAIAAPNGAEAKVIKTDVTAGAPAAIKLFGGQVEVARTSRGSVPGVYNWVHNVGAVTEKSIAQSQKFGIKPGQKSTQYTSDTDGFIARADCGTTVSLLDTWTGRWIYQNRAIPAGWAVKISDREAAYVSANGPMCRG